MGFILLGREVVSGITSLFKRDSLSRPDTTLHSPEEDSMGLLPFQLYIGDMPDVNVFLVSLSERRVFYSRKNSTSILPKLKKLVLGRHSSFYAYMNIDLATQVIIGHNFFLSSAWTGDDGQPRKIIMFPQECTQQIFNNQIDQQLGWGRIAKHPGSSSPPCPQVGGVSLSEVRHFPYGFPFHFPV
jgi:hypothetical protein